MGIRTLIVEDEPLARQTLRDFARDAAWLEIVGEAADGLTAVRLIDELKPDLLLLDVQMPELTGLQVLERASHQPAVVFTTAHDHYAVPAFELEAIDYLLKPFGRERFRGATERVRRRLTVPEESPDAPPLRERAAAALRPPHAAAAPLDRLFVRDARGRIIHLRVDEVSRFEADDDYVRVHARGHAYLVHLALNEFERRLDAARFRRVHRSQIVNLDHVLSCEPHDRRLLLRMRDGAEVLASRTGSQALREVIL